MYQVWLYVVILWPVLCMWVGRIHVHVTQAVICSEVPDL